MARFFRKYTGPTSLSQQDQVIIDDIINHPNARLNATMAEQAITSPGESVIRLRDEDRRHNHMRRNATHRTALMKSKKFITSYMDDKGCIKHIKCSFNDGKIAADKFSANSIKDLKQNIINAYAPKVAKEVEKRQEVEPKPAGKLEIKGR